LIWWLLYLIDGSKLFLDALFYFSIISTKPRSLCLGTAGGYNIEGFVQMVVEHICVGKIYER